MRVAVVILSLFAVALCAPTREQADLLDIDSNDMRVKRAEEIMMFGNQQNDKQKEAKRSYPADNIDENGYIVAKEPTDLRTEVSDNANLPEQAENDEAVHNEANDDDSTGTEEQETETIIEDSEESTETDKAEENTALEPVSDDSDDEDGQKSFDYLKDLENIQGENDDISPYFYNLLKGTQDPYWNKDTYRYYSNYISPYSNYQRYRRSQVRALKNMRFPMLKRNHRAKRQAYYVPDIQGYLPYDDRFIDNSYNNYPMTEEDLAELLDVLDDARVYDDGVYVSPYKGYAPYDEMDDIEFDSPIYMPKRQAGLTFVPGIKRNQDFYPYFSEPAAHFRAFVPDKRSMRDEADAYDTYRRIMELAAALREPENYYLEDYLEGNRRRK